MKKFLLAFLLLLFAPLAHSQGVYVHDVVQQVSANSTYVQTVGGATVAVCTYSVNPTIPCTSYVSIFSDIGLSVPKSNPLTADSQGNYNFFIAPGTYTGTITGNTVTGYAVTIMASPGASASIKPATSDGKYWIAPGGSDSNDGLSPGSAFLTPQHCVAVLATIGGGICDATALHTASFTSELDVGNSSFVPMTLLVPDYGTWTFHLTGGTAYALKVFDISSVIGQKSGLGESFDITVDSTSNVDSVCGTDPSPSLGGSYVKISGFACEANSGAVVVNAILNVQHLFDASKVESIGVGTFGTNITELWVHGVCCEARVSNIAVVGNNSTGILPCKFGGIGSTDANAFAVIDGISCVLPGPGINNVNIIQNNFTEPSLYSNIYMEVGSTDTTTTAVTVTGTPNMYPDIISNLLLGQDVTSSTRYLLDIASGSKIIGKNLELGFVSSNGINDHNTGKTISPGTRAVITAYDSTSSSPIISTYVSNFFLQNLLLSNATPTISPSTGFNTGSIGGSNGTASFYVTVGSGTANSAGTLSLPTAAVGWNCYASNQSRADLILETNNTASSVTLTNFGTTFAATNWTNGDSILVSCFAR